jgi:hypothetical protein
VTPTQAAHFAATLAAANTEDPTKVDRLLDRAALGIPDALEMLGTICEAARVCVCASDLPEGEPKRRLVTALVEARDTFNADAESRRKRMH